MDNFIIKPKIQLIGKSIINIDGLISFLEDSNMCWPEFQKKLDSNLDLGDDDGNWLIEFGGRNCYQSWPQKGETLKGRTHEEHIKNLIDSGHHSCLEHASFNFQIWNVSRSLSHELVRTRIGVAYCLSGDSIIYGYPGPKNKYKKWTIKQLYDWSNDNKRSTRIQLINARCFDGEKIVPVKIKNIFQSGEKEIFKITTKNGYSIKCSINHLFVDGDNEWRRLQNFRVGDKIAINGIEIYKNKNWLNIKYNKENLSQEEIGNICGVSKHTIRSWIRKFKLQKQLGSWTIGVSPWNKNISYKAGWHHSDKTKELFRLQKLGDKNPQWLGNLASENAGRLRAYKKYPNKPCEECGYLDKIHRHHIDKNTLNNKKTNIKFLCAKCHAIHHAFQNNKILLKTVKFDEITSIEKIGYEMTYDLEVDHPAHNFIANGFVTHNSQLSQRYVDSSDVCFIIPKAIQELEKIKPEIVNKWKEFCLNSRNFYEELTTELSELYKENPNRTERRKAARQAARSVLPNATSTAIMMTLNGRSVRYFMNLRGGEGVEPEIRGLAVEMFKIIEREFPLIIYKMELFKLQDGSDGVRTIK